MQGSLKVCLCPLDRLSPRSDGPAMPKGVLKKLFLCSVNRGVYHAGLALHIPCGVGRVVWQVGWRSRRNHMGGHVYIIGSITHTIWCGQSGKWV